MLLTESLTGLSYDLTGLVDDKDSLADSSELLDGLFLGLQTGDLPTDDNLWSDDNLWTNSLADFLADFLPELRD